jgi:hypothetical protein
MAIQTFGDSASRNPHIHVLLAAGLFRENGVSYVMPKIDIQPLAEMFRSCVLKMLKGEGKIDDGQIEKLMQWKHNSGFSVHNGVRLPGIFQKNHFSLCVITAGVRIGAGVSANRAK